MELLLSTCAPILDAYDIPEIEKPSLFKPWVQERG